MIVLILSMGQLIGSDLSVLKTGFQEWFREQGRDVSGEEVWAWMSKNLKPLRLNEITIEQFCDRFNAQFNGPSEPQVAQMPYDVFIDIFKRMATVDPSALSDIIMFARYLNQQEGKIKTILVSHTNFCQFNHILSQLGDLEYSILDGEFLGIPDENVWFATSMHSKAELHPGSLTYALNVLGLNLDDPNIHYISFLESIKGIEHIEYICPYDLHEKKLNMDHVIAIIDDYSINAQYAKTQRVEQHVLKATIVNPEDLSPTAVASRAEVMRVIQDFYDHAQVFYKGAPPKGTQEFCDAARQICQNTPLGNGENAQSNFNGIVCRRISRLANQTFTHRDYVLRFIADLIFIPLGYLTFGAAFALKSTLTGSSSFLDAKTHRQEKIEELIGEVVDDIKFMQP